MNPLETRVLELGKNIDISIENIAAQIDEVKKLLNTFFINKESINEWNDDEEDDFDDGVWIEFPFTE